MSERRARHGHRLRAWLRVNGRDTFKSADFIVGIVVAAAISGVAALYPAVRKQGPTALMIEGGLGVALLAVALTALAILVAFLGEDYVRVLKKTELGVTGAIRPYRIISVVSAATTLLALSSALVWGVVPWWGRALTMGLSSGAAVWAIIGTVQLVGITAKHGEYRTQIPEVRDEFRRGREEQRKRAGSA